MYRTVCGALSYLTPARWSQPRYDWPCAAWQRQDHSPWEARRITEVLEKRSSIKLFEILIFWSKEYREGLYWRCKHLIFKDVWYHKLTKVCFWQGGLCWFADWDDFWSATGTGLWSCHEATLGHNNYELILGLSKVLNYEAAVHLEIYDPDHLAFSPSSAVFGTSLLACLCMFSALS